MVLDLRWNISLQIDFPSEVSIFFGLQSLGTGEYIPSHFAVDLILALGYQCNSDF